MPDAADPLWYKDAVFYQVHIKSFFDSNDDGVGDIVGLTSKLDYIQSLGVSAIWIMPFYPSPLRDDGYDIADYRSINPAYGTMPELRRLIHEAHKRDLRVVTELVINHTSDQHPWFQRARNAKPGSRWRDYYVWSDTDRKYEDTRIIFIDTEQSNWTWDPVAKAYFWHRFYSHQPDLNFDNPLVMREVKSLLRYWLDMGIDGLRLDAIPYLIEREGTSSENLPETHAVLKQVRQAMDSRYHDRMLLAEANQWPEDTRPYFGDGDECHMAFHFPLMPRMYMAMAQEDRHPITDIMRQTPDIPDNCQWAIFLRNHDELTLEMVTDTERDYLWQTYAVEKRARLNLGIRRRLAPLMDGDRRKIELMNGLLLSMPGTPVLYYGDEIGMGDNIFLGDRDGVRTPMQWSFDRNGGFSRARPQHLYLPPVMDAQYGYEAVNVEAQAASPSSLLNWMRRLITVRKGHQAFGRGSLTFLYPGNRKILAYLRTYESETILCVVNLSRSAQAVELDLSAMRGRIPVELQGRTTFPPIGDLTYLLTLPSYGFYWFILAEEAELPSWHDPIPEPLPDLITVITTNGWRSITEGKGGRDLEQVFPAFIGKQRWFGAKDQRVTGSRLAQATPLHGRHGDFLLAEIGLDFAGAVPSQRYALPIGIAWGEQWSAPGSTLLPYTLSKIRRGPRMGVIHDAMITPGLTLNVLDAMREGRTIESGDGTIRFLATSRMAGVELPEVLEVRPLGVEQSNSSLLIGEHVIFKAYRKLEAGVHPELEIGRFLTEVAGFENTPALLGAAERIDVDGQPTAMFAALAYVRNQGDGWSFTVDYLSREIDDLRIRAETEHDPLVAHGMNLELMRTLGRRTAEMHRAFATPTDDPAFAAEPVSDADVAEWRGLARERVLRGFDVLSDAVPRLDDVRRAEATALIELRDAVLSEVDRLTTDPVDAVKTRLHGDYHLGQVLVAQNDFYLIDFEGEPARPMAGRRGKGSPMRDVAGMLRSLDYASWASVLRLTGDDAAFFAEVRAFARGWERAARSAFLDGYNETIAGCPSHPVDPGQATRLMRLFLLEKAFYEIAYEAANRPTWLTIPILGVRELLDGGQAGGVAAEGGLG